MNVVDRSSWRFVDDAVLDDEGSSGISLRCVICSEGSLFSELYVRLTVSRIGLSDPVQIRPCGHHFCRSCLAAWLKYGASPTCPYDRSPLGFDTLANPEELVVTNVVPSHVDVVRRLDTMEIACDCGYAGLARSHLTPSDNADTRSVCPLLRCRNADRGCNYVAHDGTGRVLHEMSCAVRDAWCHRCFGPQEATVLDNGGDDGARAFMQQQQMHRAVCRFETPLLDWSPSLKFTTTPTQVLRLAHRLRQNTGNNQDAPVALVYSGMQTASEITSFPCKYFFLPYSQCINLFFPAINLPPVRFCHDMSYICFMFQDPEGLRMVSVRLYPRSEEFIPSLRGAMDGFLEANGIPKTHPVSVLRSVRRPECIVVMGRNGDDSGEMNIEFVDGRVEVRGGTRAHEQMYDFVHFL